MTAFFSQVFSLLTSPQGNLIYQLVLAFSIAGALQPAYIHWRESPVLVCGENRSRLNRPSGSGRLADLLLVPLALEGTLQIRPLSLPPMDRADHGFLPHCHHLAVVLSAAQPGGRYGRGRLGPARRRSGHREYCDRAGSRVAPHSTTTRPLTSSGNAISIALIGLGAALLLIRRTEGYIVGLALLALAFLGHAAHLLVHEAGSYSGAIRLAYIAAFPLLLTLVPHRLAASGSLGGTDAQKQRPGELEALCNGRQNGGRTPRRCAGDRRAANLTKAVARAVAHTVLADLCFVASMSEDKCQMLVEAGYDLIREADLPGTKIDIDCGPASGECISDGPSAAAFCIRNVC